MVPKEGVYQEFRHDVGFPVTMTELNLSAPFIIS